ncbi:MAG: leucine-rich repeat domain-containing protein [Candidatus Cloacimonetes bacterium]|nr:leucine-rich repeat domain-containing protein [Candidatus Cloacimonadota bacterium]
MKIKVFLILIISILGLNLYGQLIPDDNFKSRINSNLGQPPDYEPTVEDLNGITGMLWAALAGISSIEGAQYLINVTTFYLNDNQINDISPVSGLTNLTSLRLDDNQINDISPVSGLTNLTSLRLDDNQIDDISPVSGLTNLTSLRLDENQIDDISPVSGLTNLTTLNLLDNQISDISAVSNLTNLTFLYLSSNEISDIFALVENIELGFGDTIFLLNNFLSQEALNVHIPILEDRGFQALIYSSNPNVYAACYPNPVRNAIEVPTNTTLEWNGNFPSREVNYDVWLGETSENLLNVGTGTVINNTLYSFTPTLNDNTHYWWKVRAITEADTIWSGLWHFTVGNPVSIDDDFNYLNPSQILKNFPNPFNPMTTISFDLPINITNPIIEIFNVKGEKIRQYSISDSKSFIIWDGTDSYQNQVSSGVYLYRLKSNNGISISKKMLLLK